MEDSTLITITKSDETNEEFTMKEETMEKLMKSWKDVKNEINELVKTKDKNIKKIQATVNKFVTSAQADVKKAVDNAVGTEVEKAKKFVKAKKTELEKLQKRVEEQITKQINNAKCKVKGCDKKVAATTKMTTKKATHKRSAPAPQGLKSGFNNKIQTKIPTHLKKRSVKK